MLNTADILETINMIREENLDIRTITMGISLLDCVSEDENRLCDKIYDKITKKAENLVIFGFLLKKNSVISLVTPEEKSSCAGPAMATDSGTDVEDFHLTV